jgi:hypothetical protein
MKGTKLIASTLLAITLAIAGPAGAGVKAGAGHAAAARVPNRAAYRAGLRQRNQRFLQSTSAFPYYPYYGNVISQNPDEADWAEQWTSLSEDNDGPYAKSIKENPLGTARMWVFPDSTDGK